MMHPGWWAGKSEWTGDLTRTQFLGTLIAATWFGVSFIAIALSVVGIL